MKIQIFPIIFLLVLFASSGYAQTQLSNDEFQKLINSEQPVLIDFFAPWCVPCVQSKPTIDKLTAEYANKAKVITINYDQNRALARELQVDEIPVFLVYKKGKLLWRGIGMMPEKMLREVIEENL